MPVTIRDSVVIAIEVALIATSICLLRMYLPEADSWDQVKDNVLRWVGLAFVISLSCRTVGSLSALPIRRLKFGIRMTLSMVALLVFILTTKLIDVNELNLTSVEGYTILGDWDVFVLFLWGYLLIAEARLVQLLMFPIKDKSAQKKITDGAGVV